MPLTSGSRPCHHVFLSRSYAPTVFFYLAMFLALGSAPLPSARAQGGGGAPRSHQPPQVHIRGVLVAPEEATTNNAKTLAVRVGGKSWKLRIDAITTLTDTSKSGWSLLNDLFPRRLHLIGPDNLLTPLQQETAAGKPLELEGRLYIGDQQLLLSSVAFTDAAR